MRPIKLKIDVTRIDKTMLYKGQKGTYLNCVVWPNKDGADSFGFTHVIKQELSREERESGKKEPIIGNMKMDDAAPPQRSQPDRGYSRPQQRENYTPKDDSGPGEVDW